MKAVALKNVSSFMHGTVEFIFMLVKSGYSKETCKENLFGTFIKPTFLTSNEIATRVCLL